MRASAFVCAVSLLLLAAGLPVADFRESVDVERIIIDARVVDFDGRPLSELTCEDFAVKISGRDARLESCALVSASGRVKAERKAGRDHGAIAESVPGRADRSVTPHGGRLIVLVFQRDMHYSRMPGLLMMRQLVLDRVQSMRPSDRIAVLSFDSRMHLIEDFSGDPRVIRDAIDTAVIPPWDPEMPSAQPEPSLARRMDAQSLREATTLEQGLSLLSKALEPIPGPKTVLLFGHGSGRLAGGAVTLGPAYGGAIGRLAEARAPVFSFDVTRADYHTLEGSLRTLSSGTGGAYRKTHQFAKLPLKRVWRSMDAFYELVVVKPELLPGRHDISVRVRGDRETLVFARNFYYEQ